uniref:Tubulin-tyrosine ligase n=1 Tax=viral metagenome TaxID=1070528 RepID=A0A6C0F5S1_9ZZZZ
MYIVLLIICILVIYLKSRTPVKKTYKTCESKRQNMKNILEKHNISKSKNASKWDLYIPCGYNKVESELKTIKVDNDNQIVFGISGCDKVVSKNNLWTILSNTYGRQKACTLMPETYVLNNIHDMQKFNKDYDKNKVYVLKKPLQRKKGIHITNDLSVISNAKNDGYKIVQNFLNNMYIINGRKMNIRIYVVIKCLNGNVTGYIHKEGKCIYTIQKSNNNKLNFDSNITGNNKTNLEIYQNNPLTLEELRQYFHQKNYNYDEFFNKIKHIISLTISACAPYLCKLKRLSKNTTFQLFGADIIFDKNLNPYLLEFNKGPDMKPITLKDKLTKEKVKEDLLGIINLINNNNNGFMKLNIHNV